MSSGKVISRALDALVRSAWPHSYDESRTIESKTFNQLAHSVLHALPYVIAVEQLVNLLAKHGRGQLADGREVGGEATMHARI